MCSPVRLLVDWGLRMIQEYTPQRYSIERASYTLAQLRNGVFGTKDRPLCQGDRRRLSFCAGTDAWPYSIPNSSLGSTRLSTVLSRPFVFFSRTVCGFSVRSIYMGKYTGKFNLFLIEALLAPSNLLLLRTSDFTLPFSERLTAKFQILAWYPSRSGYRIRQRSDDLGIAIPSPMERPGLD